MQNKLTPEERTTIETMLLAPREFTMCLLAAKAGSIDRKNLAKQNVSADFLAQYEKVEAASYPDGAMGEAWLIGFRTDPAKLTEL